MIIIDAKEACYMMEKARVELRVYETMEGGLWYANVRNAKQKNHLIELGSFGNSDMLVDALFATAKKYNSIACRSKQTCSRFAATATCAALSELAANIMRETLEANSTDLQVWLVSKGF